MNWKCSLCGRGEASEDFEDCGDSLLWSITIMSGCDYCSKPRTQDPEESPQVSDPPHTGGQGPRTSQS